MYTCIIIIMYLFPLLSQIPITQHFLSIVCLIITIFFGLCVPYHVGFTLGEPGADLGFFVGDVFILYVSVQQSYVILGVLHAIEQYRNETTNTNNYYTCQVYCCYTCILYRSNETVLILYMYMLLCASNNNILLHVMYMYCTVVLYMYCTVVLYMYCTVVLYMYCTVVLYMYM